MYVSFCNHCSIHIYVGDVGVIDFNYSGAV